MVGGRKAGRGQITGKKAKKCFLFFFVLNGAIYLQARLVAALLHQDREQEQSTTHDAGDTIGQTVQVVEDEDEVTTIRRPILPDITA